ncbi:MAG TPA: hypothetical protein VLQ80_08175, partial [Candidatus Saccharimonadia bacterium]|nr:hypothetical protein [Candidatus Saccharimonadia bacterium]
NVSKGWDPLYKMVEQPEGDWISWEDYDRLDKKCSALAYLQYGSSGPDDPWQAKLDEVTKPLHAEIERLKAESLHFQRLYNHEWERRFKGFPDEPTRNQAATTPSGVSLSAPTPRGSLPNSLGASSEMDWRCPRCGGDVAAYSQTQQLGIVPCPPRT